MQTPRNSPVAKPFLNIWKREIFIRFVWFRLWLLEELVITVNKPSQTGFKDRQSSPAGCYMMRASIIQKQTAGVVMFWVENQVFIFCTVKREKHCFSRDATQQPGCEVIKPLLDEGDGESVFLMRKPVRDRGDLVKTMQRLAQSSGGWWPETSAEFM